jgi:hypothetical protein
MPVIAPDGYSQNPPQTGVDIIDSHWVYVTQRIVAQFPTQLIGGIVEARDWPFTQAIDQALYLVTGNVRNARNVNSQQSQLSTYAARWSWPVIGTNLQQGNQAANRGDRYRTAETIKSIMAYGLYPGYTQKQQYSVQDDGTGNPILVTTTPYAYESVWWSKADFAEKIDTTTGILYGYAAVAISSFEPEING